MLLSVLQSAVALSVAAVVVGSAVGLIAKQRNWPAARTFKVASFGFCAAFLAIAFVLEHLLRLNVLWPPRLLAQLGFPFLSVVALALITVFPGLAGYLAQRLCSSARG